MTKRPADTCTIKYYDVSCTVINGSVNIGSSNDNLGLINKSVGEHFEVCTD